MPSTPTHDPHDDYLALVAFQREIELLGTVVHILSTIQKDTGDIETRAVILDRTLTLFLDGMPQDAPEVLVDNLTSLADLLEGDYDDTLVLAASQNLEAALISALGQGIAARDVVEDEAA